MSVIKIDQHLDPGDVAAAVGRGMVEALRDPETRAGMVGAFLTPLIIFRGRRVPLLPFIVVAVMGDQAGRMAWRASRNLDLLGQLAARELAPASDA